MTDWYRNTAWSEAISQDFEARLARARSQKAQYLLLQGQALIADHPDVATELLERTVTMGDPLQTPRALAYLAQARMALNDVEGALRALERGLEAQAEQPNLIAVQASDYAFIVGYFDRAERLAAALKIAEALPDEGIFGPDLQLSAGKAMVFEMAGHRTAARTAAIRALGLMEGLGEGAALGINLADLRAKLARIAEP